MTVVALDTSTFIAALCAWHEAHDTCAKAINGAVDQGTALVLPAHALLEAYAVLTRLPPGHRIGPGDAALLIEKNQRVFAGFPAVPAQDLPELINEWSAHGYAGGRIYDLFIAEAAIRYGATEFWTLNPRHVTAYIADRLQVWNPAVSS